MLRPRFGDRLLMLRVSVKGVWALKLRLLLTALAIVLGVGLITGVYVYTD